MRVPTGRLWVVEDPEPQTPRGIDEGPPSPGRYIREQRLRQGMTLEEVSAKTKIPRSSLEALEEERWSALPGPVFVKGFLRCCARALEIDDQVVLDLLYEQERAKMHAERDPEPKPEPEAERRPKRGRGFGRGLFAGRLGRRGERSKGGDAEVDADEGPIDEERGFGGFGGDDDGRDGDERGYGRRIDPADANRGYSPAYETRGPRDGREDPRDEEERGYGGAEGERSGGGWGARDEGEVDERFGLGFAARDEDGVEARLGGGSPARDGRDVDRGYGLGFDGDGERGGDLGGFSEREREPWRDPEWGRGGDRFGFEGERGGERGPWREHEEEERRLDPWRGRGGREGEAHGADEADRFGRRGSEPRLHPFEVEGDDRLDREAGRSPGRADRFGRGDDTPEEGRGRRGRRRSRRIGAERDEADDERWDGPGRGRGEAVRAGPRVPSRRSLGRRSARAGEEREPRAPSELLRELFASLGRIAARLPGANIFLWVAVALLVLGLAFAVLMAFGAQQAVPPQS